MICVGRLFVKVLSVFISFKWLIYVKMFFETASFDHDRLILMLIELIKVSKAKNSGCRFHSLLIILFVFPDNKKDERNEPSTCE